MTISQLPPPPVSFEYGEYPWLDWWNKVRDFSSVTYAEAVTAATAANTKLSKDANDVLSGTVTFGTAGAFKVGTVTWDGTNVTGTGLMFTANGIVGASGGSAKFVLKSDGTATFAGDITGANGTFNGNVSSTGYLSVSGYAVASGQIAGNNVSASVYGQTNTAATSTWDSAVFGYNGYTGATGLGSVGVAGVISPSATKTTDIGVYGFCRKGAGVFGSTDDATGFGVIATNTGSGGTALKVNGKTYIGGTVECNDNLLKSAKLASPDGTQWLQVSDTQGSGTGTANFVGTNKPGGTSSNGWLRIDTSTTTYYIPVWT